MHSQFYIPYNPITMPVMPLLGNIKSRSELQDELFCVQEERDYFQSKFLEQVSEIKAMKDELAKSKKEIRRLRIFLMEQENHPTSIMPEQIETPKNEFEDNNAISQDEDDDSNLHIAEKDDASSLTEDELGELDEQDEQLEEGARTPKYEDEARKEDEDVRQSAEKLLAWASYRTNMSSRASRGGSHNGDHSSVMSPSVLTSGSARQSLLGKMIETMEDEDESVNKSSLKPKEHVEEKKEEEPLGKASLSLEDDK